MTLGEAFFPFAETATYAKVRFLRSFYATKVALRNTGSNARYGYCRDARYMVMRGTALRIMHGT